MAVLQCILLLHSAWKHHQCRSTIRSAHWSLSYYWSYEWDLWALTYMKFASHYFIYNSYSIPWNVWNAANTHLWLCVINWGKGKAALKRLWDSKEERTAIVTGYWNHCDQQTSITHGHLCRPQGCTDLKLTIGNLFTGVASSAVVKMAVRQFSCVFLEWLHRWRYRSNDWEFDTLYRL